jgi:hypothetical protein
MTNILATTPQNSPDDQYMSHTDAEDLAMAANSLWAAGFTVDEITDLLSDPDSEADSTLGLPT